MNEEIIELDACQRCGGAIIDYGTLIADSPMCITAVGARWASLLMYRQASAERLGACAKRRRERTRKAGNGGSN